MNSTDAKLYELFWILKSDNGTVKVWAWKPQLHDVFRESEINNITFVVLNNANIHFQKYEYGKYEDYYIQYNPTLPLLQQEESTKEKIISLFS